MYFSSAAACLNDRVNGVPSMLHPLVMLGVIRDANSSTEFPACPVELTCPRAIQRRRTGYIAYI
jgi:hypothetical protein